jgi:hypothetical protein
MLSPCECNANTMSGITSIIFCSEVSSGASSTLENSNNSATKRNSNSAELGKIWNLEGLVGEISRHLNRATKKLEVATTKYKELVEKSDPNGNGGSNSEQRASLEADMNSWKARLEKIKVLEDMIKVKNEVTSEVIQLANELDISDMQPPVNENKKKAKKAVVAAPRKPYYTFTSLDGIEIFAGRSAEENDELSTKSEYRHDVS